MPTCLGAFISQAIYQSKLKSNHEIKTSDCLKFVDVGIQHGEETKDGFSWKNPGEVHIVVQLIKTYYRHKTSASCRLTMHNVQQSKGS
ncbi:hypothetical protein BDQ17DRAFT_1440809 [Cyathus striatus]|nr:hypothetical protein BDQ17DRAFT_1441256 [Cyathus striatus]KAF8977069.1 hypothetical protein BDQ17DRAFT_1440809 [Cyathus striatus]